MWDLLCRLRRTFHYTWEEALFDIPLDRAWAEHAWAIENDPVIMAFGNIKREGNGYVFQERDRLMAMIK